MIDKLRNNMKNCTFRVCLPILKICAECVFWKLIYEDNIHPKCKWPQGHSSIFLDRQLASICHYWPFWHYFFRRCTVSQSKRNPRRGPLKFDLDGYVSLRILYIGSPNLKLDPKNASNNPIGTYVFHTLPCQRLGVSRKLGSLVVLCSNQCSNQHSKQGQVWV